MLLTEIFTRARKEPPKDEVSKNARFLIRAGFIDKLHAGVYSYLPFGLRVIRKIESIIREEMNTIGGQEILMPSLHPKELWQTTGRWDTMDDLYKVKDSSGKEFALGGTHEEVVVPLAKQFVSSYKDLPFSVYQIQNKFRMELRAKSGILRGREFLMKDMYSFHKDEKDLELFYDAVKGAYKKIFQRVGLGDVTHFTFASGGTFSQYSHEFQTVTSAGEDIVHICTKCGTAVNDEIKPEKETCPDCGERSFKTEKAIEVGNIFPLKTKYTDPFSLTFKDQDGTIRPVVMGCYGIGLGRLMGAVAEVWADERGLSWPESISPFDIHLVEIGGKNPEIKKRALSIYESLEKGGRSVLFDNRNVSAGEKFAEADLIGITKRVVVSEKTIETGLFEVKVRNAPEAKVLSEKELLFL